MKKIGKKLIIMLNMLILVLKSNWNIYADLVGGDGFYTRRRQVDVEVNVRYIETLNKDLVMLVAALVAVLVILIVTAIVIIVKKKRSK